jgi:outer membrane protein OmpA-like peptidoglycan-associated protein
MSSLAHLPEIVGFFSYSREDDESSGGMLSALRHGIEHELSAQLGRSKATFRIWQDQAAISPGQLWESEMKSAVEQAVFFILIVTPRTVSSHYCKFEFENFLAREYALGRTNLVFPLLYIRVPALEREAEWRKDPVLSAIGQRQYVDWRQFRHRDVHDPAVRTAIADFCDKIVGALSEPWVSPEQHREQEIEGARRAEEDKRQDEAARLAREERRRAEAAGLARNAAAPGETATLGRAGRPLAALSRRHWRLTAATGGAAAVAAAGVLLLKLSGSPTPTVTPPVIGDAIFFERDQVTLTQTARAAIEQQAGFLRDNPGITVTIKTYCPNDEAARADPKVLAQLRAHEIRHELEAHGIKPDRIKLGSACSTDGSTSSRTAQAQDPRAVLIRN